MLSLCAIIILTLTDYVSNQNTTSDIQQPRILIIGAGMAGLSAAERLEELGFNNYAILEATDWIGGRIRTENVGDGWMEMGAQNVHGKTGNIVYDLALKHDLIDPEQTVTENGEDTNAEYRMENGETIDKEFADEFYQMLIDELGVMESNCSDYERTVGSIMDEIIDRNETKFGVDKEVETKRKLWNLFKRATCQWEGCDSLSELTVGSRKYYEKLPGDNFRFRRGYSSLVQIIHSKLKKNSVLLRSPVDRIKILGETWTPSDIDGENNDANMGRVKKPMVSVSLEDGTEYLADHVIVTVSLGELKRALSRSMFEPRLSEAKVQAIENMGFGTLDRICLVFDPPFWSNNDNFTGYWLVSDSHCDRDVSTDWWSSITGFTRLRTTSNVLFGWIAGNAANRMEELDDTCVLNQSYNALIKFTGDKNLPRPKSIKRTKWRHTEYIYGSYSYMTGKASTPDLSTDAIAAPIYAKQACGTAKYPVIMFAGEATHTNHYSTVHGARASGIREANRIAEFY